MQVKELKSEGLKREFKVTLLADDINKKVEHRLQEVAKTIKLPGFRPGKVPLSVVKKKHGKEILGETLERVVADSSSKVLSERELHPALQPQIKIDSFDEGADLVYNLSLEIYPEVPAMNFSTIKIVKSVVEPSDADVTDALAKLQKAQRNFVPLKKARAAKLGDAVVIDFVGKVDDVAFEGGAGNGYRLELGSNQFIPGFEDQLVGAKKDEDVAVKVTFPKDYGSKDLAGKKAVFDVKIHDILQSEEAELTDEFAAKFGFENLEKLKDAVKQQVQKDFDGISRTKLKKDLFDALDKECKFTVPEGMVTMEYDSIVKSVGQEAGKEIDKKQQKEYKELAERRVRLGIILADVGRTNAVAVTDDEIRRAVFEQARNFPGQEQRVIEYYQKNKEALDHLRGPILEEKVVDFVVSKISVQDKKVSSKDLLKFNEEE